MGKGQSLRRAYAMVAWTGSRHSEFTVVRLFLANCCPIGLLQSCLSNGKFWQQLPLSTSGQNGSGLVLQGLVILPMSTGSTPSNSISRTTRMSRHINSWPLVNRTDLTLFCQSAISSSVALRVFPALPCNLMAGACSNRPRIKDFSQYHRLLLTARTHTSGLFSKFLGRRLGNSSK